MPHYFPHPWYESTDRDGDDEGDEDAGDDHERGYGRRPTSLQRTDDESVSVDGDPDDAEAGRVKRHGERREHRTAKYGAEHPPVFRCV